MNEIILNYLLNFLLSNPILITVYWLNYIPIQQKFLLSKIDMQSKLSELVYNPFFIRPVA